MEIEKRDLTSQRFGGGRKKAPEVKGAGPLICRRQPGSGTAFGREALMATRYGTGPGSLTLCVYRTASLIGLSSLCS